MLRISWLATALALAPGGLYAQETDAQAEALDETADKRAEPKDEAPAVERGLTTTLGAATAKLEIEVAARSGYQHNLGVRRLDAAVFEVEGDAKTSLALGIFELALPLSFQHTELAGASLRETRGRAEIEVDARIIKALRVGADAGVVGVWRPDWPDLYQPLGGGAYAPTDRHGYWQRRVGLNFTAKPVRRLYVRAKYRYVVADYAEDPNFDAANEPTHLVPTDHSRHEEELSVRYVERDWKAGVSLEMRQRDDRFAFARDAGTGATHAAAGGPPPNPLQELNKFEPALGGEIELFGDRVEIQASYGYEIMVDTFQGYYSYRGHHPEIEVRYTTPFELALAVGAELRWRTYGPDSYAAGGSHPPLQFGDRRVDRRLDLTLAADYPLMDGLRLGMEISWRRRSTNFPDYAPGVYPATRQYDIRWSYDNLAAMAGVRYEL